MERTVNLPETRSVLGDAKLRPEGGMLTERGAVFLPSPWHWEPGEFGGASFAWQQAGRHQLDRDVNKTFDSCCLFVNQVSAADSASVPF